jgi:3'-phosphoadenosine 5'-phosphosulfate sulfotransferase (PAPS reductase)/FAD synthetase
MCQLVAHKPTKEEKRAAAIERAEAKTIKLLPLDQYDYIIVSFSGGKDSLACALALLKRGVDPNKMELWHQGVDGEVFNTEENFMDWPITEAYCRAVARHLKLPIRFQWRDGGFYKELTKTEARTGDVYFEDGNGKIVHLPTSDRAKVSTRGKYPMPGNDLSSRWCSPALKIDVFARAVANDPRFDGKKILVVTGERGQESDHRALYAETELHRCHAKKRLVHSYRIIHKWTEEQVWDIIREYRIVPHPAYRLGFSRVSCLGCIFGNAHQWATVRKIAPGQFDKIAGHEAISGGTIKKGLTVIQQADNGVPYTGIEDAELVKLAMGDIYPVELVYVPESETWVLPLGAYKQSGGPT